MAAQVIQDLDAETKKAVFDLLKAELQTDAASDHDDRKLPSLVKFSGGKAKGEASYRKWKFEVQELIDGNCPENKVRRAIQKSLFGHAAEAFMSVSKETSVKEILEKFDKLYLPAKDVEQVYGIFYVAKQEANESLSEWYVRLETILNTPSLQLTTEQKEKMLRSRFWKGLHSDQVKDGLRHKFDNNASSIDLLDAARIVTEEAGATAQSQQAQTANDQMSKLHSSLEKLLEKVTKLEDKVNSSQSAQQSSSQAKSSNTNNAAASQTKHFHGRCHKCHRFGHKAATCKSQKPKE